MEQSVDQRLYLLPALSADHGLLELFSGNEQPQHESSFYDDLRDECRGDQCTHVYQGETAVSASWDILSDTWQGSRWDKQT